MSDGFVLRNPDRRTIALITLRSRLKLEMKVPPFAKGKAGRMTMRCAKEWVGPIIPNTRNRALELVSAELETLGL